MKKITSSLDSDIISNLPRNITETILSCLPLRDAVRTSILSTKWRYYWINLPKLVFDETMCQLSSLSLSHARCKVISIIYQILILHQGPVQEFSLSHHFLEICPEIDNIIMCLSKNSVEKFTLNILKGGKYKLPSSFFSYRELTHLNLSSCVFTPPLAFEGFRRLISLKFVNVDLATDLFGSFISSCRQLERLTLINPSRFHCSRISAPNLKFMHVVGYTVQIGIVESEKDLSLKDGEECILVRFFQCLPALNTMITNYAFLKQLGAGGVPEKLLSTSINLKFLKIFRISFYVLDQVSILFALITSLSMQQIEIEVSKKQIGNETPVLNFLEALDCNVDIMLDELREVRLFSISGMESELMFIKILLARSPVLEKMFIRPRLDDVASRLELFKSLVGFERLAPMVNIICEEDA